LSSPEPGYPPRADTARANSAPANTAPDNTAPDNTARDNTARDVRATPAAPYDPLRLCIFATIALLGWLGGPWALAAFAALGFAGYWRARGAGLLTSKCFLRDTRLVLTYLALLFLAAGTGIWWQLSR
jgi:hypothetical protein